MSEPTEDEYQKQMQLCARACSEFARRNSEEELDKLMLHWVQLRLKAEKDNDLKGILLYQLAMLGLHTSRVLQKEIDDIRKRTSREN